MVQQSRAGGVVLPLEHMNGAAVGGVRDSGFHAAPGFFGAVFRTFQGASAIGQYRQGGGRARVSVSYQVEYSVCPLW